MSSSTSRKCVLITGAGSGIGAGLATAMAEAGHEVIAADLQLEAAAAVAAGINAGINDAGGRAQAIALDVSNAGQIDAALDLLSRADVLINNAGLQHVSRIEAFPPERWQLLISVMLTGAANMIRAVLPGMRARGHGRIINIGSIHSLVASPYKSAYVAAKHGLVGLSKVIALETADTDITVNTICPAYVRTPLVERQIEAQAREHGLSAEAVERQIFLAPMPKQAFVTVEEVAALAEFLMSDAARNITGQSISIDGGWTSQ